MNPRSGVRKPGLRYVLEHPLGPTAWQLNYWRRMGFVPELGSNGVYGAPVEPELQRRLIEIARLCGLTISNAAAARLSRLGTVSRNGVRRIPAGPGITIIIEPPDRVDT